MEFRNRLPFFNSDGDSNRAYKVAVVMQFDHADDTFYRKHTYVAYSRTGISTMDFLGVTLQGICLSLFMFSIFK